MTHDGLADVKWYCLRTEPKREHIAGCHLEKASQIEVFCPRLKAKKYTVKGSKWFVEAMFPGYLFARFCFADRHREIQYSPGVTSILAFGGKYAVIADETITGLKLCTDGQSIVEVVPDLEAGDNVSIAHGALSGLEAVIKQVMPAKERVKVLLNFLGQQVETEVGLPDLVTRQRHPLSQDSLTANRHEFPT